MTPDIVWCTSLPSRDDPAAQASRVASWGGREVTFNDAEESALLYGAAAERVVVARSGRWALGKPVPFLSDVLDHQAVASMPLCGIVNADISFEATEAERRWLVAEAARGALVCIRRTDVPDDATPLSQGSQLPQGFDAFLFPREMASCLRAEGFCLGMPFWDFWLPAAAALLTHQLAACRGLADLAASDEAAAGRLSQVYDGFQSRVLDAVAMAARVFDAVPSDTASAP